MLLLGLPVMRTDGDTPTGWQTRFASGVRALAVSDTTVALHGGYGPDRDRLVVGELDGRHLRYRGEYRLVLPDGSPLPVVRVSGRGATVHLLTDTDWFRLDLDDIPARIS